MPERELTEREIERQDLVDNAIHKLIEDLAGGDWALKRSKNVPLVWDIEVIGKIREVVQEIIVNEFMLMTEMEFYPYLSKADCRYCSELKEHNAGNQGHPEWVFMCSYMKTRKGDKHFCDKYNPIEDAPPEYK